MNVRNSLRTIGPTLLTIGVVCLILYKAATSSPISPWPEILIALVGAAFIAIAAMSAVTAIRGKWRCLILAIPSLVVTATVWLFADSAIHSVKDVLNRIEHPALYGQSFSNIPTVSLDRTAVDIAASGQPREFNYTFRIVRPTSYFFAFQFVFGDESSHIKLKDIIGQKIQPKFNQSDAPGVAIPVDIELYEISSKSVPVLVISKRFTTTDYYYAFGGGIDGHPGFFRRMITWHNLSAGVFLLRIKVGAEIAAFEGIPVQVIISLDNSYFL